GGPEGGEQLVARHDVGVGDGVEERRLAGVGVPDQRDDGRRRLAARTARLAAALADLGDGPLERGDTVPDAAPVDLELGLAWAQGADAATQTAHRLTAPRQPRQLVLQLGQFDLHLGLAAAGVAG